MKAPLTPAQRVARSRAKTLASGDARQINIIIREPALSALDRLTQRHGSNRAAIEAALLEAESKI